MLNLIPPILTAAGVIIVDRNVAPWVHANLVPSYDPEERNKNYIANWSRPNLLPSIGDIFDVYYRGEATYGELASFLKNHGVSLNRAIRDSAASDWWSKHLLVNRPRPPLDVIMRANALGKPLPTSIDDTIRFLGIANAEARNLIATDSNAFSIDDILTLFWRGDIGVEDAVKWLKHAGYRDEDAITQIFKTRRGPSGRELLDLLNRGVLTEDQARNYMRWTGVVNPPEQDALVSLRYSMPSPTEIGIIATRHAFNDAYIARFGLNRDMPEEYRRLTTQLGFNWASADNGPQQPGPGRPPFLERMWAAHWRTLDVGTAIEMLRRLRPDGGRDNGARVPGVPVFTAEDFADVLASNEIIPGFREQIRAVSYTIPSRLFVKRLYSAGIIDRREVKETLKDQGYDDTRSEQMTKLVVHEVEQARVSKLKPVTIGQVKHAYKVGTIDRNAAARNLHLIYLSDYQEQGTYASTGQFEQTATALANPWVILTLNAIDSDIQADLAAKAIDVIRKAYLRSEVTSGQAIDQLTRLGIVYNRSSSYVQLWSYELAAEGTEVSAARLIDWYVGQLIDQSTLTERLGRLHYTPADAALIIAGANVKLSEQRIKLAEKAKTLAAKEAKGLVTAQKALMQQSQSVERAMCKSANRTQLARWAAKGLISRERAFLRLTTCGMSAIDANRLLDEAASKKGKTNAKKEQPQESSGIASNPPAVASASTESDNADLSR